MLKLNTMEAVPAAASTVSCCERRDHLLSLHLGYPHENIQLLPVEKQWLPKQMGLALQGIEASAAPTIVPAPPSHATVPGLLILKKKHTAT
jgi:hypothetical protein